MTFNKLSSPSDYSLHSHDRGHERNYPRSRDHDPRRGHYHDRIPPYPDQEYHSTCAMARGQVHCLFGGFPSAHTGVFAQGKSIGFLQGP